MVLLLKKQSMSAVKMEGRIKVKFDCSVPCASSELNTAAISKDPLGI